MRRPPPPEPLSPRALARLRTGRPTGWVPSPDDLGLGPDDEDVGPGEIDAGPWAEEPAEETTRSGRSVRSGRAAAADGVRARWVRAPAAVVGAQWQPGRAAVLGVALVTVVAVLLLGLRVAWARESPGEPVRAPGPSGVSSEAVAVGAPGPAPDGASSPPVGSSPGPVSSASGAPSGSPSPPALLVVHVVGEVRRPGVRRLPAGSRVVDAVEAAGGATAGAALGGLNLARPLVDGEQVRVPRPGEEVPPSAVAGPLPSSGPSSEGGAAGSATPVSLNTADVSALDTLPGIGPVIAQRIVDWRTANGRFTSVDELSEVSGIGEKLLAQVRPLVTV